MGRPRKWRAAEKHTRAGEREEDEQGRREEAEEKEGGLHGDVGAHAGEKAALHPSSPSSSSTPSSPAHLPHPPSASHGGFSDSPSFLVCLSAFLASLSPPLVLPSELLLPSNPSLPLNLFRLYARVVYCGGVELVESTLGWTLVLEEAGLREDLQSEQLHLEVRALWDHWLQPFYAHCQQQREGEEQPGRKEEERMLEEEEVREEDEENCGRPGSRKRTRRAGCGASDAAPPFIRRSGRERKRLRPSEAALSAMAASSSSSSSSSSSPFIDALCAHCEQFDHHASKLRCSLCSQVFHSFCLSPPLPDPTAAASSSSPPFLCRACMEREQGEFGFDAGGFYTLSQFQRMADAFKAEHFRTSAAALSAKPPSPATICAEFWRIATEADHSRPVVVEYGSDLDTKEVGTVFPATGRMADDGWNLHRLPRSASSVLQLLDDSDIEGISIPWLYVGMLFSAFCWHNEDHYSYSINYVAEGEDKQWYGVGATNAAAFEQAISERLPHLFTSTPDLLFHLITMLDPALLLHTSSTATASCPSVCQLLQHAGEIVITFPQAYHAGFNHGFNVAESVNFAPHDWLPYGLQCTHRYRAFHRQPVWACEQIVLNAATQLLEEVEELKREAAGRGEGGLEDAERRRDEEASARDEPAMWERAAWVFAALRRVRDEEYQLRRALYQSGTTRMQPWLGAAQAAASSPSVSSIPALPRFHAGDSVLYSVSSAGPLQPPLTAGTVLASLGDAWYSVKQKADGLVLQVEGRRMQREERKEDQRTHDWHGYQTFGQDEPHSAQDNAKQSRPSRMAAASSSPATSSPASSTSSLPRCLVCRQLLYLSCVQCSCTLDKFACLRHSTQLCGCLPKSRFARTRHHLAQLDRMVTALSAFLGLLDPDCVNDAPDRGRAVKLLPLDCFPATRRPLRPRPGASEESAQRALATIEDAERVLARRDEHVEDTQRRIQKLHGGKEQPHGAAWKGLTDGSVVSPPMWSTAQELAWSSAAFEWELRHRVYLELTQPSLSHHEAEGLLKEAERYIWADARMDGLRELHSAIAAWTTTATSLSLSLCSLVSAHYALQAQLAALQAAEPNSASWRALVTSLFTTPSSLPGLLRLEEARAVRSAIERCPVRCACVCQQLESRFRLSGAAGGARKGAGPARGEESHLATLTRLLDTADARWQARAKPLGDGRWSSLVPRHGLSGRLHEGLSYAASAVLLPDHQAVLKRGKAALLSSARGERKEAEQPPSPPAQPVREVKGEAKASGDRFVLPSFFSAADFHWPALPPLTSESDCAVVLTCPLSLNDAVDVAAMSAELSRPGSSEAELAVCCSAFTALFSPHSPLPSLTLLAMLHQQLQSDGASCGAQAQQLRAELVGCVVERLQRAQVWLAHCARLLSSRDGEGGGGQVEKGKAAWLGAAVGPLVVVRGVVCRCPPMLSLGADSTPSLSLCSAPHAGCCEANPAMRPRFSVCCVQALLHSTALQAVDLHDMRELLAGALKRTDSWADKVDRLLHQQTSSQADSSLSLDPLHTPSAHTPLTDFPRPSPASSPSLSPQSSTEPVLSSLPSPTSSSPSRPSPSSSAPLSPSVQRVSRLGVAALLGLFSEGGAHLFSHPATVRRLSLRLRETLQWQDRVRAAAVRIRRQVEELEQLRLSTDTRRWLRSEQRQAWDRAGERSGREECIRVRRAALLQEVDALEADAQLGGGQSLEELDWLHSIRRTLTAPPRQAPLSTAAHAQPPPAKM